MKTIVLDLSTFAFVISTRAALAFGFGLLMADRLGPERRRRIGTMLVAVGAATTIPAALAMRRSLRQSTRTGKFSADRDEHLIGATRFPRKGDDDIV